MYIVTKEKVARQYVKRPQFVPALARLVELNIAPKHWKNITVVIPRIINRREKVRTDRRRWDGWGTVAP